MGGSAPAASWEKLRTGQRSLRQALKPELLGSISLLPCPRLLEKTDERYDGGGPPRDGRQYGDVRPRIQQISP